MNERYQFGFVPEKNNEKIKRMQYVVSLAERGLKKPKETIGYVGTSLVGIENLVNHGSLPGGVFQDPHMQEYMPQEFRYVPSELSISSPRIVTYSDIHVAQKHYSPKEFPLAEAKNDAFILARAHAFMTKLRINPGDGNKTISANLLLESGVDDDARQEALERFIAWGYEKEAVSDAIEQARNYRGFVLSLKSDKARSLKQTVQSEFAHVFEIEEAGVPLDYFDGLEFEGPIENAYMDSLKKKI